LKGREEVLDDYLTHMATTADIHSNPILESVRYNAGETMTRKIAGDRIVGFEEAVDDFEKNGRIVKDMQKYYGMDEKTMTIVLDKMKFAQRQTVKQIKERKWFPTGHDNVMSRAPFMESQLDEGVYLLPFDKLEKILIKIRDGKIKDPTGRILTMTDIVKGNTAQLYDVFNDIWRPLVLMRLGYTQRNVTEGLFRSMAFNESFMPVAWAGQAAYFGTRNIGRAGRVAKQTAKGKTAVAVKSEARDEFDAIARETSDLSVVREDLIQVKAKLEAIPKPPEGPYAITGWVESKNGVLTSQDGMFRVIRKERTETIPESAPSFVKTDAGYVFDGGVIVKEGRQWKIGDQSFPTLKAAKESLPVTPAGSRTTEKFFTESLDGQDQWWPHGQAFDTVDDAKNSLIRDVEEAQAIHPLDEFGQVRDFAGTPRLQDIRSNYGPNRPLPYEGGLPDNAGTIWKTPAEVEAEIARVQARIDEGMGKLEVIGPRPMPEAVMGTKFGKWRQAELKRLTKFVEDSDAYEANYLARLTEDGRTMTSAEHIQIAVLKRFREDDIRTLLALERDDAFALQMFQSVKTQQKGIATQSQKLASGVTLNDAFSNPMYSAIARGKLSADNTVKATMSVRMNLTESFFMNKQTKQFLELPKIGGVVDGHVVTAEEYFDGMATMLRQYTQSKVGQDILRGIAPERTAAWLLNSEEGQKIADSLSLTQGLQVGDDMETAIQYVNNVRKSLEIITANDRSVWQSMISRPISSQELRVMLEGNDNLGPIIGNIDELTGAKAYMDMWRTFTSKTFKLLGSMPEDAFVRAPFYAKSYKESSQGLINLMLQTYKDVDSIPLADIQRIERISHAKALADTKKWLYTIDRRTNVGKYMEAVFPFISATQNSLTALGRLTVRDPALPGMMLALWRMPTKTGWEDDQGNLVFPMPHNLIPDGVEDFFGLQGIKDVRIGKNQLNVIFPESGFAYVPRPSPLVQVAASELMKRGLFGQSVEAPPIVVSFLGKEAADQFWGNWKDYLFGEQNGVSPEFMSWDKVTPPVANKMIQLIQGDSSSQYGYQYALQARSEDLRWQAQAREDYPTPEEIQQRTAGQFLLRMFNNLVAFTPPQYTPIVQPLLDAQRKYDAAYGLDGPMKFSEKFGNELLITSNTDTTKNTGGTLSTMDTVRGIRENEVLIRSLSPNLGDDLAVLGIIVNGNQVAAAYDTSAYRWLSETPIPGRSENWRTLVSGPEALAESQRTAGWVEYMKFKSQLDAQLKSRGKKTYGQDEELNQLRKSFTENMLQNPMYAGWRNDFLNMGSTKTASALTVIDAALHNEKFMAANDNATWRQAAIYMTARDQYATAIKATGHGIDAKENAQIAAEWEAFRQDSISQDEGWAAIANRYLMNDSDPSKAAAQGPTLGGPNG
jgi:hypothetical protein